MMRFILIYEGDEPRQSDSEQQAIRCSYSDEYTVIDTQTGEWIRHNTRRPLEESRMIEGEF